MKNNLKKEIKKSINESKKQVDKKEGKYLFISKMRQLNIISYMNQSDLYSKKDIDDLYDTRSSNEASLHYLLGVLISQNIKKLGNDDLIELAQDEPSFRTKLAVSKSKKIQSILEKFNIKYDNILTPNIEYDPKAFNIYSFIRLMIHKKGFKLLDVLSKKKLI